MKTSVLALVVGVLLGVAVMLLADRLTPSEQGAPDVARDLLVAPAMTQAAANKHREDGYRNLTTIEDIVALPTEFARAEATYALAGRSDSGAIQAQLFEVDRIADDIEREALLEILFFRLAELDPQSALALARTDRFRPVKALERMVWRVWARAELDEALFAAKAQTSIVDQKSAAQSLYDAFGYMGNPTTERIEAELGIEPDRSTRARYLYRLADESPAEAIAFINGVTDDSKKRQYVSWLANYLSRSDPAGALRYASLFSSKSNAQHFEQTLKNNMAVESPQATIERLVASGLTLQTSREFDSAVQALAKTDMEEALRYFQEIRSTDFKRNIGASIAAELAKRDPDAALAWARENELRQYPILQIRVLQTIASEDPQRAMDIALAMPNSEAKSQLLSQVIQSIAYESPTNAIAYLDKIDNADQKIAASQYMLRTWARGDAVAAMEWVLSQDDETKSNLLEMAQHVVVENDIEAAIRLLPRLEGNTGNLKLQIAERLANSRSPDEALSFIHQFEGEQGYDQLQSTVINVLAQTDVYSARQLADQMPSGAARDKAYVGIIAGQAQANPVEATRWLNNVEDPRLRGSAAGQVAAAWFAVDPAATNQWISAMPPGVVREHAIMRLASQWRNPNPQLQTMIESISDPAVRGQAKVRRIYSLMTTNPGKAYELSKDEDIPAQDRKRIEVMLGRRGHTY